MNQCMHTHRYVPYIIHMMTQYEPIYVLYKVRMMYYGCSVYVSYMVRIMYYKYVYMWYLYH